MVGDAASCGFHTATVPSSLIDEAAEALPPAAAAAADA